ncbi:MAG: radical SAM protein [Butyricicoccus sp.]
MTHSVARSAFGAAIDLVLKSVNKDRQKGFHRLVDLTESFAGDVFSKEQLDAVRKAIDDPDNKWVQYINRLLDEIDPHVIKMTALNMGFEAFFHGTKTIRKNREKYHCNIPWLILFDPTSACNMHCTGCWAAEYGHKLNLSFEDMDRLITQGKELGVYFYMLTGGEPLVRKNDIIRLCEKHNDCEFNIYTNSTLIDDDFCKECVRVGNISFSLSIEGTQETNDGRRGSGHYDAVMNAMKLMKQYGIIFGTSICYTRANVEAVTSDEFLDMLIANGVRYSFYFHYMPVGNGASPELLPTPEQREYMIRRVREVRGFTGGKQIFLMDFQNDGEYVGGCIAGGRNYFHVNSNGDAEPCVFIHYSDCNIRDNTLLEILQSPLFMAYHNGQPFNENHLRPCPMLENPELLQKMVRETGAKSTDLESPESAEHLCAKCAEYASQWKPCAEHIWETQKHANPSYLNYRDGGK